MFDQSVNDRLTEWTNHRRQLDESNDPLQAVWDFWHLAPFVPHNKKVDPYYHQSWPTPWDIIVDNKYDDFTKALMISWTLKLTKKFQNSKIEIRTLVDSARTRQYNLVYIDEDWVINYNDNGPTHLSEVPDSFRLENLIEVSTPR
jgi:hypothetical protein